MTTSLKAMRNFRKLSFPWQTSSPFLFCVFHHDSMPPGDDDMQAPGHGNGADFDWNKDFRFYHGDRIPGFPAHPHKGFETVTATLPTDSAGDKLWGVIDHADSMGNGARYGRGDLQWMTAGKGIQHGEMFPLVQQDKPNKHKFFQIWLNLPAKSKLVEPFFVMHWAENIKTVLDEDNGAKVVVWAGEFQGARGQTPPPNSWAADERNDVAILYIALQPNGGKVRLPPAKIGADASRQLYYFEGAKQGVTVGGDAVPPGQAIELEPTVAATIVNNGDTLAEFLVLQGRPIDEPVVQHGPFVMNTRREIQQAFEEYQATRFGGWPWPRDDNVFPRDKGRFAKVDGVETLPPQAQTE